MHSFIQSLRIGGRDRIGIEAIGSVLKRSRSRLFGHVETGEERKGLGEEMLVYGGGGAKREAKEDLVGSG